MKRIGRLEICAYVGMWEDSIKVDIRNRIWRRELDLSSSELTQWRAVVNTAINNRFL